MKKFLNIILVIAMIALMIMPVNAGVIVALANDTGYPKEIKYGDIEYCNCGIDHTNKPFEWWTDITDRDSPQWDLIHNYLTVQEDGTLATDDDYTACALGRYFGKIGSKWIFICEDGLEIKVVKADEKQDRHTKNYDLIHGIICNELIELVVDSKISKTCPTGNFKDLEGFEGNIIGWKEVLENDLPDQLKGSIYK